MNNEQLLKPTEVAEMLQVSVFTLYGWTSGRRIPFRKVGRLLRFDRAELEAWTQREGVSGEKLLSNPVPPPTGRIAG